MDVIAFVGPSGTGKSHRALLVAHNNQADAIIDSVLDGIRFLMKNPGITGSELIVDNGFRFGTKMK